MAWRQNVLPVPMIKNGVLTAFRSGGKSGLTDIVAIVPPNGRFLGIEVKTDRDKIRPTQESFIRQAEKSGASVLVVKDYGDFVRQFSGLFPNFF